MSVSFWFNLSACIGALWYAFFEHAETWDDYKSSTGRTKRWRLFKVCLLWAVPATTLIATMLSARESLSSDSKIEGLEASQHSVTNDLAATRQALGGTRFNLTVVESNLTVAKKWLGTIEEERYDLARHVDWMAKQANPREISKEGRDIFISLAKAGPMCPIRLATVPQANSETLRYFDGVVEMLLAAGYEVTQTNLNISGLRIKPGKSVALLFTNTKDYPSIMDPIPINHLGYLFMRAGVSTLSLNVRDVHNINISSNEIIVVVIEKN